MAVRARQRVLRSQPRGQRGIRRARGGVLEPRRRADEGAYREVVDRVVAAREHAQAHAAGALRELGDRVPVGLCRAQRGLVAQLRSEEHTSELQSLMRISYAVFCLKKKTLTPMTN